MIWKQTPFTTHGFKKWDQGSQLEGTYILIQTSHIEAILGQEIKHILEIAPSKFLMNRSLGLGLLSYEFF